MEETVQNYHNPIARHNLIVPIRKIREKLGLKPIANGYMKVMPFSKLKAIYNDMKELDAKANA
ncbi:hypothetical protein [Peijinzhouia sedimentorum]